MCMQSQKERGAIMIMTAIFSVVLIGIAALAIDLGRLYVLEAEMQNAADAAALAAAAELDGTIGARDRAVAAARELLSHRGRFARDQELLKQALVYNSDIIGTEEDESANNTFSFYCAIGSEFDLDPASSCAGGAVSGSHYFPATNDIDSHYVRVSLRNRDENDYYIIDLFFLPVLNLLAESTQLTAAGFAEATAGRQYLICNYPPLMICDPFEASGGFKNVMIPGHQIQLKLQQGHGSWSPGDFAFLEPSGDNGGAMNLADYIADEQLQMCTPPIVTTKPGNNTGPTTWAINTRFDLYMQPSHYDWPEYPPAPNVISYPRDSVFTNRIGNGEWDRNGYWSLYHSGEGGVPATLDYSDASSINFATATRWQVYNWEIEQNNLPCRDGYSFIDKNGNLLGGSLDCSAGNPSDQMPKKEVLAPPQVDGKPASAHLNTGDYPPPQSTADRRRLFIATLSCNALGINGKETVDVIHPDGFARIFITEHTNDGSYEDESIAADLTGEYIGWTDEKEEDYHVIIQLYE